MGIPSRFTRNDRRVALAIVLIVPLALLVRSIVLDRSEGRVNEAPHTLEESLVVLMDPMAAPCVVDCGTLAMGESVERSFRVPNPGEEPITIRRVESFCGCARLDWDRDPIEPGESAEVHLRLDALKFPSGPFEKRSVIHFTDRAAPPIAVVFRGRAEPLIWTTPGVLALEPILGESVRLEVVARPRDGQGWTIHGVGAEGGHFEVAARERTADGALDLVLTATGTEARRWSDYLVLSAEDPEGQPRTIRHPVTVEHRSRIEVRPDSRVIFTTGGRAGDGGSIGTESIEVGAARDDIPFRILTVEFERGTGNFSAEIRETSSGPRFVIDVRLLSSIADGQVVRDRLIVRTDDPISPVVAVDVVAMGRSPLAERRGDAGGP